MTKAFSKYKIGPRIRTNLREFLKTSQRLEEKTIDGLDFEHALPESHFNLEKYFHRLGFDKKTAQGNITRSDLICWHIKRRGQNFLVFLCA